MTIIRISLLSTILESNSTGRLMELADIMALEAMVRKDVPVRVRGWPLELQSRSVVAGEIVLLARAGQEVQ